MAIVHYYNSKEDGVTACCKQWFIFIPSNEAIFDDPLLSSCNKDYGIDEDYTCTTCNTPILDDLTCQCIRDRMIKQIEKKGRV